MSRIPRTFIEETTPAIARMRSKKLRVAILHSGGPAPGGNRVLAGAAKQFLDRGIQAIGFINGYEFLNETSIENIEKNVHYIEIDKKITSQAIDTSGFILRTARANPGGNIKKPEDLDDDGKNKNTDECAGDI